MTKRLVVDVNFSDENKPRARRQPKLLMSQCVRRLAIVVCMASVLNVIALSNVRGQDDLGREAFQKKTYPWYNAESDQVQRVEMADRPAVKSEDRETIPLAPFKRKRTNNAGNWNWGNGWSAGLGLFAWLLIGGLLAMVVGVLIWVFLMAAPMDEPLQDEQTRRSIEESIKELPFDLDVATGDFRDVAERYYASGDYRKAMIYLFSHVLVSLDQNNRIRLRKGKTNRQYLRELRPTRSLADFFQGVMVPFEATFFW